MPVIELHSNIIINPLYVRSVSKSAHFWGDKVYVTLHMRGAADIEIEKLTSPEADKLIRKFQLAIEEALHLGDAYEEACEAGRSDGYSTGYDSGYSAGKSEGYQEAKDQFWSHDREEYRINEYNLGYESGRQNERENSDQWSQGYNAGVTNEREKIETILSQVKEELVDSILQRNPTKTHFSFQQLTLALDAMARFVKRKLNDEDD